MTDKQVPNDLCMLLQFALARGSLGSIVNALKILYGKPSIHSLRLINSLYLCQKTDFSSQTIHTATT